MDANYIPIDTFRRELKASLRNRLAMTVIVAALLLVPCRDAGAQNICMTGQLGPGGVAYPLLDWRLIANAKLPQVYSVMFPEDLMRIQVGGRERIEFSVQ